MSIAVTLRSLLRRSKKLSLTLSEYWTSELNKDPYLRNAVFCADLVFGNGKKIQISTKPITVLDENNQSISYNAHLVSDPKVDIKYDYKGSSASQRTINIEIDARVIDPSEIILSGFFLCGVGEISLQINGSYYDDRFILIQGDMVGGIEFGAEEETITLSIGDPRGSVDKIIPEAFTTKEGFPFLPDDNIGFRFPLAFTTASYIPAISLSANKYGPTMLVCGGNNFQIAQVWVDGELMEPTEFYSNGGFYIISINWTEVHSTDELGNAWTGVSFQTQSSPVYDGVSVYASIIPKSSKALGILDIIEKLVTEYTQLGSSAYDFVLHARSMAKGGSVLRGEVVINASSSNNTATAFTYIEQTICSEYPMLSPVYTGRGYGIVYTDRKQAGSRLILVRGQGLLLDRIGVLKESPTEEIYNVFTLRYNYNPMTDSYGSVIQRDSSNSNLCGVSEARIGRREMQPMDSILIKDDNTAMMVIDWYINHSTLPSYSVSYCATPKLFFMLQIGDNVELTDDRLGFENVRATVNAISLEQGKCEITFQLWLQYQLLS